MPKKTATSDQSSPVADGKIVPIQQHAIHPNTFIEGFTQSEFSEMSCMQRWNWRYNQLLRRSGSVLPIALRVGTAFHDAMEQFYKTKGERVSVATLQFEKHEVVGLNDIQLRDYWNLVLPAMVDAYMIYYKGDPIKWEIEQIELEVDVVYRGIRVRGKIDLRFIYKNGRWILDHKTTSRLNQSVVAGWDFRFQFMFYIWLMSKMHPELPLKGYVVNAVKKPELRVKQSESIQQFAMRVREDMIINPDKYFYREEFPVTKGALDHFEREVVDPRIDVLLYIQANPTAPLAHSLVRIKNTDECQKYGGQPCAYIDLCRHGIESHGFLYEKKPAKHEELEAEEVA